MRPAAYYLKNLQEKHTPLAHVGKYAGQYQFVGRLSQDIDVVEPEALRQWFELHPQGRVVTYFSSNLAISEIHPDYKQDYRGDVVVVLNRHSWELVEKHPGFKTINE